MSARQLSDGLVSSSSDLGEGQTTHRRPRSTGHQPHHRVRLTVATIEWRTLVVRASCTPPRGPLCPTVRPYGERAKRPRPSTAYIASSFRKPRGAFARTDDLFGQTLAILDGAGPRLVRPCDAERGQGTPCRAAGGRQPIRAAHPPMNRFAPTGHRRVCAPSRRAPNGSSARNPAAAVMQKLKNTPPPLMQELTTSDRPQARTSVRVRRSSSTLNHSIHPP